MSIEKLEEKYQIRVKWRAFPLHPDTPEQGLWLDELFKKKGISVDVDKMMAKLKTTAENLGLELGDRKKTYNSRLAQELGLWAETQGKGHAFHLAAFRAYFAAGKNIADKNVLLDLAESVGLPEADAREVIDNRVFSDAVDRDWELSRKKGVTAVPTFFMGPDRLVGAQPYEVLDKMVARYAA